MTKKILIVEDNKDSLEILSLFITKIGHQVIKACNSEEAITCAEAEDPDLIFMESRQPRNLNRIPRPLAFPSSR